MPPALNQYNGQTLSGDIYKPSSAPGHRMAGSPGPRPTLTGPDTRGHMRSVVPGAARLCWPLIGPELGYCPVIGQSWAPDARWSERPLHLSLSFTQWPREVLTIQNRRIKAQRRNISSQFLSNFVMVLGWLISGLVTSSPHRVSFILTTSRKTANFKYIGENVFCTTMNQNWLFNLLCTFCFLFSIILLLLQQKNISDFLRF